MLTVRNLNEAVVKTSALVVDHGEWRDTRGFRCLEYPEPLIIKITNPQDRILSLPARKWKAHLAYAESLWLAAGLNSLDALTGQYAKSLYDYSDDGKTWRAAYGTRFRHWWASRQQYPEVVSPNQRVSPDEVDQYKFIIACFEKDPNTRQALITVADPGKDCFEHGHIISTKDVPCTRSLHFIKSAAGKLDLIVHMRSNDLEFGMGGVNIFNFTLMQEYFSVILKLPMGNYYHMVDNLHVYDAYVDKAVEIASIEDFDYEDPISHDYSFSTLTEFDSMITKLLVAEDSSRLSAITNPFADNFFGDWFEVLRCFWMKKRKDVPTYNIHSKKLKRFLKESL